MTPTEKVALAMAWYDSGLEDRAAFQTLMESLFAQPEKEPVAWEQFYPEMGKPKLAYLPPTESPENACYTPPPQRTWVGLESDDYVDMSEDWCEGASWAETKLKEKNA